MPLFKQYTTPYYQWAIWKVEESVEELHARLPAEGCDEYLQGMEAFTSEARRKEWLAVRVLLFEMLGEMRTVCYEPGGKPYWEDCSASLSISHTKGYVSAIVGKDCETVGIDIEQCKNRVLKVAHKFIREEERSRIPAGKELLHSLLIWSAKEVMFKCMDTSGVDFRKHLLVEIQEEDNCLNGSEFCTPLQRNFLIPYIVHKDFVMTWTAVRKAR